MKVFINVILILTTPLILKATEFSLDLSQQEIARLEGTERHLSLEQLNELRPWAENSQILLKDLLNTIKSLSKAEKESELLRVVKDVVLASAPKNTELLMRYVLNRGVIVYKMLRVETNGSIVGSRNARIRILEQSVHKALHYYQSDLRFLQGGSESVEPIPFAQFGVEYFQFLLELSKSVFDASAQYEMTKMSLEFLQWDLYRDLDQKVYAPQILKINNKLKEIDNALKSSPITNLSRDQQLIDQIRNMKKLIENLELEEVFESSLVSVQTSEAKEDINILDIYSEEIERVAYSPVKSLLSGELLKKTSQLTFSQCVSNAGGMPSYSDRDKMRKKCIIRFKKQITFSQCVSNADKMYDSDNETEMRKWCTGSFKLTFSQCVSNAGGMPSYSTRDKMRKKCIIRFKKQITFSKCVSNADKMYGSDNEKEMREWCMDSF